MKTHLWVHGGKFWWLDHDHVSSGQMGETAAGPFETREAALEDLAAYGDVEIIGDTMPAGADYPEPDDDAVKEAQTIIGGMDEFTLSYMGTALWTGVERTDDDPLRDSDKLYDRPGYLIEPATLRKMIADCEKFQKEAGTLIEQAEETGDVYYGPDCQSALDRAGHDFWLTRNGHGAGFWDGDWPEPYAKQLTDLAHAYGECDLYMGDNGHIDGS